MILLIVTVLAAVQGNNVPGHDLADLPEVVLVAAP